MQTPPPPTLKMLGTGTLPGKSTTTCSKNWSFAVSEPPWCTTTKPTPTASTATTWSLPRLSSAQLPFPASGLSCWNGPHRRRGSVAATASSSSAVTASRLGLFGLLGVAVSALLEFASKGSSKLIPTFAKRAEAHKKAAVVVARNWPALPGPGGYSCGAPRSVWTTTWRGTPTWCARGRWSARSPWCPAPPTEPSTTPHGSSPPSAGGETCSSATSRCSKASLRWRMTTTTTTDYS